MKEYWAKLLALSGEDGGWREWSRLRMKVGGEVGGTG